MQGVIFICWVCGEAIDLSKDRATAYEKDKWAHSLCFEQVVDYWRECRENPTETNLSTL